MKQKHSYLLMIISAVLLTNCSPGNMPATTETLPSLPDGGTESDIIETGIPEKGTESENETDSAESAVLPLGERLSGRYRTSGSNNADENVTYLEIYWINGNLIAEAEESQAAYWAMELLPSDKDVLYSTSSDTVQAEAYTFSGFSTMGAYWDESETYTLRLTDTGVDFTSADGITETYIRHDSLDPLHIPSRYREALDIENNAVCTDVYAGEWAGNTEDGALVYLRLGEDSTILCLYKQSDEPVCVHTGLRSAVSEDGTLSCMTERIGWGDMPWFDTISFSSANDGNLKLMTDESCSFLPPSQTIILEKLNSGSAD